MTKLTKLLNEKVEDVKWLRNSIEGVIRMEFPLTNSIAKELELGKTIEALHFTDAKGAIKLISMQGSNKSISAMTKIPAIKLIKLEGIWKSGVVYKVQGTLLIGGIQDIMSRPDQRGRRWINFSNLGGEIGPLTRQQAKKIEDKYRYFLKENKTYMDLKDQYKDKIQLKDYSKKLISMHFNLSLEFVKKNKHLFEGILYFPSDKIELRSGSQNWDEVVLSNIELLAVAYDKYADKGIVAPVEKKIISSVPPGKALAINPGDERLPLLIKLFEL